MSTYAIAVRLSDGTTFNVELEADASTTILVLKKAIESKASPPCPPVRASKRANACAPPS
jgi:hypothetical protein